MMDRTDLQLMACERIKDMEIEELIELIGANLQVYDADREIVVGKIESLEIPDPGGLKTWIGFMLYALGERVEGLEGG